MIKETCSCGASFEASGPKADARVAEWRVGHLLHGNTAPPYIPSYPIYPGVGTYPTQPWWTNPTITFTSGNTLQRSLTTCVSEVMQ